MLNFRVLNPATNRHAHRLSQTLFCCLALLTLCACSELADCLTDEAAFVTESIHENNLRVKLARVPDQVITLRSLGVSADDQLQFEVFFYAHSEAAAKQLTFELAKQGYDVGYGPTLGDANWMYTVQGSSPEVIVDENAMTAWVFKMCEIGYLYDVKFEDWYFKERT